MTELLVACGIAKPWFGGYILTKVPSLLLCLLYPGSEQPLTP
jgi:hypothetical protein